jgi:RND family efflux transporter MFP subunit
MRRRLIWIVVGLALVAAASLTYRVSTRLPTLAVAKVKSQAVERVLAAVGRVRAEERVSVYARTAGQILTLIKDEGDRVTAGELLGSIDAGQPRAVLAQRRAAVTAQRRQTEQSTRDLARAQSLLTKGFITRAGFETARLAVQRDMEQLTQLEAAVAEIERRLDDYRIVAPMSGRILLRPVDPGQVVDVRTQIFELVSQGAPEVETDVDETVAGALQAGMRARLAPAGMEGAIFDGRVIFVAPRIEPTTGGRTVRLSFDSPPKDIPPGLSVDVNITVETRDKALTLPRGAIASAEGESYVIVVRSNRTARQVVSFIDWPAERVIVTSGVSEGDDVAIDPLATSAGVDVTPAAAPASR